MRGVQQGDVTERAPASWVSPRPQPTRLVREHCCHDSDKPITRLLPPDAARRPRFESRVELSLVDLATAELRKACIAFCPKVTSFKWWGALLL